MKCNKWTLALIGAGLVSAPAVTRADEATNAIVTALSATTISGYVSTSAEWNPGTGNANLPPYAWGGTGKADGFNLDVVKLTIARDVVPTDSWGAGYKVDLLFGPDASAFHTQSTGISADFAVKQAYVALHAPVGNGLDFKIGVWDTLIGYEVFESPNDPNFTRSYAYTIEPTTHTGLQATYQFCDAVSATVGIADSFGPTINGRSFAPANTAANPTAESFKTYMGSITFTAPTNMAWLGGSTLTACIINGYNSGVPGTARIPGAPPTPGTFGNIETHYYVGATVNTPLTWLKVGGAFDYLDVHNLQGENWVIGGYVSAQATEKLSFNGRAEYMVDDGAQKLFVDGFGYPIAPNRVGELTLTAQYDLWKNVLSRIEFRWDHSLSGEGVWGGTAPNSAAAAAGSATGTGTLKNEWLLAANIVYKF
jgi:hypothetical protein